MDKSINSDFSFNPPEKVELKDKKKAELNFEKGTLTIENSQGQVKTYNIKFGNTLVRDPAAPVK